MWKLATRRWGSRRPVLLAALAAIVVVAVVGGVLAAVSSHGHDGRDVVTVADAPSEPGPSLTPPGSPTSTSTPTPSLTSSTSALPNPVAPPSGVSESPATVSTSDASPHASAHTSSVDPYCGPGGLPPGMHSDAACDVGKHTGIPTQGCEVFHGCAWPDSWGATPAGPYELHLRGYVAGDIAVSWTTTAADLAGDYSSGPVHEFVVRLYRSNSTTMLRQEERSTSSRAVTLTDVPPGSYSVWLMELNDSGLSSGIVDDVTVPAPATASPTPSPTATPTPAPTS